MDEKKAKIYKRVNRKLIPAVPKTFIVPNKKKELLDKCLEEEAKEAMEGYAIRNQGEYGN